MTTTPHTDPVISLRCSNHQSSTQTTLSLHWNPSVDVPREYLAELLAGSLIAAHSRSIPVTQALMGTNHADLDLVRTGSNEAWPRTLFEIATIGLCNIPLPRRDLIFTHDLPDLNTDVYPRADATLLWNLDHNPYIVTGLVSALLRTSRLEQKDIASFLVHAVTPPNTPVITH